MQEYFKFTRIYFDTAFNLIWLEDFDEKIFIVKIDVFIRIVHR